MLRLGLLMRSKIRYKDIEVSGPAWLVLLVFITGVSIGAYLYFYDERFSKATQNNDVEKFVNKDRCNVDWKDRPLFCSLD